MDRYSMLDTPCAIVELPIIDRNITNMVATLQKNGIAHRPHTKAHKCAFLAKRQIELGAKGITCAKVSEAEAMAGAGITDILIANEIIGEQKVERMIRLSEKADIISVIDSLTGAETINECSKKHRIVSKVYVDVDIGAHRCGLTKEDALELCRKVMEMSNLEIVGLFGYSCKAYGVPAGQEMIRVSNLENELLMEAKDYIESRLNIRFKTVSSGCSLSSRYPETLAGITECRAGNYIFNDATALKAGVCTVDDCSLRVVATVISNPEPGRILLDAGTKALSSDGSHYDNLYGYVIEYPDMEIYNLNEEHAYVRCSVHNTPKIGEKVTIIPNHSCVISNLFGRLVAFEEDGSQRVLNIEGRGALQ